MKPFTFPVVLAADATIDLQMHTTFSDGTWTPEQLIDYLVHEQFGLAAITDPEPPGASRYPDLIGNPRIGNLTLDFDGTLIYP